MKKKPYNNIEVIDRIGSGDAYLAGVLYGLIKYGTPERAIEIGNALSALKTLLQAICQQAVSKKSKALLNHTKLQVIKMKW